MCSFLLSANPKLVYLVLGVLVKITIDKFDAIAELRADELQKEKERIAKYIANPAVQAGSLEQHRIVCEREHAFSVGPQLAKLTRIQRFWQYGPFGVYLLLTVALFAYALLLPDSK